MYVYVLTDGRLKKVQILYCIRVLFCLCMYACMYVRMT